MSPMRKVSRTELAGFGRYFTPVEDGYVNQDGGAAAAHETFKIGQFAALVKNDAFPCVGAKSAFSRNTYRIGLHGRMGSPATTRLLAEHLHKFVAEQDPLSGVLPPPFTTYAAIFDLPHIRSEAHAHSLVWKQLQLLHREDSKKFAYAPDVSDDPNAPDFAFSVGGKAFFVVGLNPCASRFARRFAYPTLVFNAHSQFAELRARGLFERIQTTIRGRDNILQGNLNPNLSNFGERSEAMQYSGLEIVELGLCPFHSSKRSSSNENT